MLAAIWAEVGIGVSPSLSGYRACQGILLCFGMTRLKRKEKKIEICGHRIGPENLPSLI
jgi:hypothetical protein